MAEPGHTILVSHDDHLTCDSEIVLLAEKAADLVLQSERVGPCEVSIHFTDNKGIEELNRTYRNVAAPTDVLSFGGDGEEERTPDGTLLLGDVIVSLDKAKEQAAEYGHSLEREVAFLVVHGMFHLLGYDHQTDEEQRVMRAREEEVLQSLGLTREP